MITVLNKRYPGCVKEHKFHDKRRWKFDFAWPELKIALEIEGGGWVYGRHNRPQGHENDCEKYSEAAVLGWRIIHCTPAQCKNGFMYDLLDRAMGHHEG